MTPAISPLLLLRSLAGGTFLLLLTATAARAACTLDAGLIFKGESRPVLICGADITEDSRLATGSTEITVDYAQVLRRCGVTQKEPGIYAWLRAGADARSTDLRVGPPGKGSVCEDLRLTVPEQALLPMAKLRPADRSGKHRLEVDLGKRRGAAGCSVAFPADPRWPAAVALSPDDPGRLDCSGARLRVDIRLVGEQRFPVPVVISGLMSPDGEPEEALAWFEPPVPEWEDDLTAADAHFIDVNGYRTRYFDSDPRAAAERDTLLLIHGGQPDPVSPTAEYWRPNFAALARDFRVIAVDALGHGATDNPRTPADYARYYELIVEHFNGFVDQLGLKRVHVVGHSQGGWSALRLALNRPDIMKCVVSVDTVMAPFTANTPAVQYFAYAVTHIHPPEGANVYSLMRGERFIGETWNNISRQDADRALQWAEQPKFTEAKAALGRLLMSPGNPYFRKLREQALAEVKAGGLEVPHLLVWGKDDRLAPLELGRNLFDSISRPSAPTSLHVIGAAGHSPQVEQPEAFNGAIRAFCGQYRRR